MSDILKFGKPIKVPTLAADPAGAENGVLYYSSALGSLRTYQNGSWGSDSSNSGEPNLINSPSDASGWVASGAGITVATSSTPTDLPLIGLQPTSIKITPVSSTDYVRYRWTMPAALKGTKLKIEWFQRPLSGYVAGDLKVELHTNTASDYTGTDVTLLLSTDVSGVSSIPSLTGKYTTTFDTDASDYYELRIIRTAGTTALNICSVIVGPGIQPQGYAGGYMGVAAFSGAMSGLTTNIGAQGANFWRRGDRMYLSAGLYFTGANTDGIVTPSMPTGYTVDTSKMFLNYAAGVAGDFIPIGGWTVRDDSTLEAYTGIVVWDVSGAGMRLVLDASDGLDGVVRTDTNIPITFTTDDSINYWFEVPVVEWVGSGSVNLAQNDVEYAYNTSVTDAADTTSFGYGAGGTPFPGSTFTAARNKTVRFTTPIRSTDIITMEIQPLGAGTEGWVPLQGSGTVGPTAVQGLGLQNTFYYGAGIHSISSSTDVIVRLGQYAYASGATYGAAGTNWDGTTDNFKWRLKKSSGGQAVGFGEASSTIRGLSYGKQSSTGGLASAITDATFTDTTGGTPSSTLTITPGTYLLTYGGRLSVTYSVLPTAINGQIRVIDTGDIASVGTELIPMSVNTATLWRGSGSTIATVVVSTTTTYKLQGYIDVLGGTVSDRSIQNAFMVWERIS